ncbi:nucleotidyltransferase family protein [Ulvibacterium sp.]|uniref:nucleotidyltransferase family protein n=1 Tax=Ulvibacterium sp. TaxID=2665914 RepID=UPI003CC57A5B
MGKTVENIAILVLAAGASSRMGTAKQLLPWNGANLLDSVIKNALMFCPDHVVVVLGANAEEIQAHSAHNKSVQFVFHKNWKVGLGSSIAYGVDFIQKIWQSTKAILILLGDQPLIDAEYVSQMIQTYEGSGKGIIATEYDKGVGVPAIFDRHYFSNLAQLNKDSGAKQIIKKFKNDTFLLGPSGKTMDIDTMEDYQKLIKIRNAQLNLD